MEAEVLCLSVLSTAVGHKRRLEEVLEETGGRKKPSKSMLPSSISPVSSSTDTAGEMATLATTIKNDRKFYQ